ncbi:hypothetical protein ACN2C6_14140 [Caulobacter sp. ErkDOM-YI]|uniref:hypothetical protein n=1 Tax=unclassified Caulobacter TaxID=2648921 RepID=UPI003AF98F0C
MTKSKGKRPLAAGQGGRKTGGAGQPISGPYTTYIGRGAGWTWVSVAEEAGVAVASSTPLPDKEEEAAAVAEAASAVAAGATGLKWVSDAAEATAGVAHDACLHFRRRVRESQAADSYTMEPWGREIGAWLNVERYGRLAAYRNRVAVLMQAEQGGGA